MTRILAINGSYRDSGVTDQVVELMAAELTAANAAIEIIRLRDYPIEFCTNCRKCTQQPGSAPGDCIHHDGMEELVRKIETSDGYILASPTNFGSVTAVFKRFMERLVVYANWSWKMKAPEYRKAHVPKKKAVLVSSCAAPSLMGRWFFSSRNQLKSTAQTIGAKSVGTLFIGLAAGQSDYRLTPKEQARAKVLASKLI